MSFVKFLQAVLDSATLMHKGEPYPASDVYTPAMLDAESHDGLWEAWRVLRDDPSAYGAHVRPNGETWSVTL